MSEASKPQSRPLPLGASPEMTDFEIVRQVLASTGCDGLGSRASDAADFALERIEKKYVELEAAAREVVDEIKRDGMVNDTEAGWRLRLVLRG